MNAQEMWLQYRNLAFHYAWNMAAPIPMREEVVGEAMVALGQAIRKYRPERGPFPPYLRLWVRSVIRQQEAKLRPLAASRRAVADALTARKDEEKGAEAQSNWALQVHMLSLEEWLYEREDNRAEPVDEAMDVEEEVERRMLREAVARALEVLSPRQRQALILYFGLDGVEGRSYADVARLLGGITRQRAHQIVKEALEILKEHGELRAWVLPSGE